MLLFVQINICNYIILSLIVKNNKKNIPNISSLGIGDVPITFGTSFSSVKNASVESLIHKTDIHIKNVLFFI